jgi:hypothetical protein
MSHLDFTSEQIRQLRVAMGLAPDGPEPEAGALVAIIEIAVIIEAEAARLGLQ